MDEFKVVEIDGVKYYELWVYLSGAFVVKRYSEADAKTLRDQLTSILPKVEG